MPWDASNTVHRYSKKIHEMLMEITVAVATDKDVVKEIKTYKTRERKMMKILRRRRVEEETCVNTWSCTDSLMKYTNPHYLKRVEKYQSVLSTGTTPNDAATSTSNYF